MNGICRKYTWLRWIALIGLVWMLLLGHTIPCHAQTNVISLTADPSTFRPDEGESTTFTAVLDQAGMTTLEIRVYKQDRTSLVRSGLVLVESATDPGTYQVTWNGKDAYNSLIAPGTYDFRIYNLAISSFIGPWGTVALTGFINSIEVNPQIFAPDGCNTMSITMTGDPGQVGLTYSIYSDNTYDIERNIALTESVAGSGIYSATWDGVPNTAYYYYYNGYIVPDGNYSIRVFNSSGAQSPITKSFSIDAIRSISSNPSSFCAATGESTTISFLAPKQQEIDVRFRHSVDGLVASVSAEERIVAVTDGYRVEGTGYLSEWNGTTYQDALRYVYKPLSGDGEMSTHIQYLSYGDSDAEILSIVVDEKMSLSTKFSY